MKKINYSCFAFLILFYCGISAMAQPPKLSAAFYYSSGIVVDSKGNAFVTGKNDKIIKITPQGKAELFAGDRTNHKDGKGKDGWFSGIGGIAIDAEDNMYVADRTDVRKITPDGIVSTISGIQKPGSSDGDRATASFIHLENIAVDNKGNIYVTDYATGKGRTVTQGNPNGTYEVSVQPLTVKTTLQRSESGSSSGFCDPKVQKPTSLPFATEYQGGSIVGKGNYGTNRDVLSGSTTKTSGTTTTTITWNLRRCK